VTAWQSNGMTDKHGCEIALVIDEQGTKEVGMKRTIIEGVVAEVALHLERACGSSRSFTAQRHSH